MTCHDQMGAGALGIRTEQLNFAPHPGASNELAQWSSDGLFTLPVTDVEKKPKFVDVADPSVPLSERARTYLAVNCAYCHQPGGLVPSDMDLGFLTPLDAMNVVDAFPLAGDLGIPDARIIAPGDRSRSVLWQRLRSSGAERMPPIGRTTPDPVGVSVIGAWIDSLAHR
jgi:hypothetical protein